MPKRRHISKIPPSWIYHHGILTFLSRKYQNSPSINLKKKIEKNKQNETKQNKTKTKTKQTIKIQE